MDTMQSEWTDSPINNSDSKDFVLKLPSSCVQDDIAEDPKSNDLFPRENFTSSPTFSVDSGDNLDYELHTKTEHPLLKTSIINASLAKRRLQAYSKQIGKSPVKEEKNDSKQQKDPVKKTKKDLYPNEKAKAVIKEIEEIKRKDQERDNIKKKEFEQIYRRLAAADAVKCHERHQDSGSPDPGHQFKRREFKQRNYRRTDSFSRTSPTPPEDKQTKDRPKYKHPRNWTEYKKQSSSVPRSDRGRNISKKAFNLSVLKKVYNFGAPSTLIAPCRIEVENGFKEVSIHSIKLTKSRPTLIYSCNTETMKDSFPTRNQLYDLIPKERQQCIKDVINKHSKLSPATKKMTSQPWYHKQWRKSSATECKILEKSVGLSFLQNYSDEEEDAETEEIIICSTTKKNTPTTTAIDSFQYEPTVTSAKSSLEEFPVEEAKSEQNITSIAFSDSKSEASVLTPERNRLDLGTNSALEEESGILTPDISALQLLQIQKNVPKSDERNSIEIQITKDTKSDPKKKKNKRKLENEQSEDDSPKRKKKRKSNRKKSISSDGHDNKINGNKKRKKVRTKDRRIKKKKLKVESTAEKLKKKERQVKKKRKLLSRSESKSPLEVVKKKPKKKIKKQSEDKKSSNKKQPSSVKQKRVEAETSDSDSEPSKRQKNKEPSKLNRKIIKKEEVIETSEKPATVNDIDIKQEPEDDLFLVETNKNHLEPKTPDNNKYSANWESEEENLPKEKPKPNTSCWESDEDLYENRLPEIRPVEKLTVNKDWRDLEIPLNNKQRRDSEVPLTNKDWSDLEIPLNIKPFKRREIIVIDKDTFTVEESPKDEKIDSPVTGKSQITPSKEAEKKGRWDKKETESKTEPILVDTVFNKSETTYTVLENEYEEFMKAVSSNTNSSPVAANTNVSIISISSNDSKNDVEILTPEETNQCRPIIIAPSDIPFIPMPEELKLQPVPSPKVVMPPIPSPKVIIPPIPPPTVVIPPLPPPKVLIPPIIPSPNVVIPPIPPPNVVIPPIPSPKVMPQAESVLSPQLPTFDADPVTTSQPTDTTKSFTFTTLMLPSKKLLLDNSNLKLGDSDDEPEMKPIEDVKRELSSHARTDDAKSVMESTPGKTIDLKQILSSSEMERAKTKVYSIAHNDKPSDKIVSRKRDSHSSKHRRDSPRRKSYSPREFSPRRRKSPERYKSRSPTSRRYHSRRYSPHRRRSPSPRRRRSPSPPRRRSPNRSASPRDKTGRISSRTSEKKDKIITETKNVLSSPLEGPKRSVADSTISDDSLLPQPNLEEYTQSPITYYADRTKFEDRKRLSLDERISLELGYNKDDFKPISTTYDNFSHNRFSDHSQIENYAMDKNVFNENVSANFVQLGNMVEIVPTDLNVKTEPLPENKSRILQVGNVLQIVPTELPPEPPPLPNPTPPAPPKKQVSKVAVIADKQAIELNMKESIEERKAEREKRKLEREVKRKEKENRRREKEKRRQIKMKEKTENMIKKALQLEVENQDEEGNVDLPAQWPPIHISSASKDFLSKKSILLKYGRRSSKCRKKVQFADGIRPGEGTSPSAGEDLCSPPPPTKVLPKEKRYTKTKLGAKKAKKKVKVKIIKPGEALLDSDEDDNLPPPSPPPGSPPPHVFPPRIKTQVVPNHGYVPNVINQTSSVYRPSVNLMMMQPHLPDSPMQMHAYGQYQVPPLPPSASLTPGGSESATVPVHRNHFNYSL